MALVVRQEFHLNGTLRNRGEVLSGQDAADVEQEPMLLHRCNFVPDEVFASAPVTPPPKAKSDSADSF